MRVMCQGASGLSLPEQYIDLAGGYTRQTLFPVTVDKTYVIYAMTLRRGGVWYYIIDDRGLDYPVWYPAPLFRVVDGRVSRYWTFGFHDAGGRDGDAIFAFPSWSNDPFSFYDALSEGETTARDTFRRYAELLDSEFADTASTPTASDVGDGWLQCAKCNEAWRTSAGGEQVRCPSCGLVQLNPRLIEPNPRPGDE